MTGHRWEEDPGGNGFLVCPRCGEWSWPGQDVKGYYLMRARDSGTNLTYSWTVFGPEPDYAGAKYLGPFSPTDVSVAEKRTIPVSQSCDECLVSDVMAS